LLDPAFVWVVEFAGVASFGEGLGVFWQPGADGALALSFEVFAAFSESVEPFDADAAAWYARIVARRDRLGQPADGFDAQIAAIAGPAARPWHAQRRRLRGNRDRPDRSVAAQPARRSRNATDNLTGNRARAGDMLGRGSVSTGRVWLRRGGSR
jgi:hypothetical protein